MAVGLACIHAGNNEFDKQQIGKRLKVNGPDHQEDSLMS
jgi:hypothetical protein